MIDCPKCWATFRGLECSCGYKVPPRAPLPFAVPSETEEQEIERRRERVAELKRKFFRKGAA